MVCSLGLTQSRRHLALELPFPSPGLRGGLGEGCPATPRSVFCSSRDPADGLGAQAAAAALRGGPGKGLGVGQGRQRQRAAGAVSPALRPPPVPDPPLPPACPRASPDCTAGSRSRFTRRLPSLQPDPVAGGQAEPAAQLHERDVDPDPLGDAGEPGAGPEATVRTRPWAGRPAEPRLPPKHWAGLRWGPHPRPSLAGNPRPPRLWRVELPAVPSARGCAGDFFSPAFSPGESTHALSANKPRASPRTHEV